MTLLRAEEGFSALKGSLGLRPNFHQLEGRVEGHVFISVPAYHLLRWIGHRLTQNGDARDWQTIRRLLRTHSLVTTRLPLKDWRVIEVRKPSLPDAEQARVCQRLGIDWKRTCPARKSVTQCHRNENATAIDLVVPFETNPCKINGCSLMIRNSG